MIGLSSKKRTCSAVPGAASDMLPDVFSVPLAIQSDLVGEEERALLRSRTAAASCCFNDRAAAKAWRMQQCVLRVVFWIDNKIVRSIVYVSVIVGKGGRGSS